MTRAKETKAFSTYRRALEEALTRYLAAPQDASSLGELEKLARKIGEEGERRGAEAVIQVARLLSRVVRLLRERAASPLLVARRATALTEGVALFGDVVSALASGCTPRLEHWAGNLRLRELLRALEEGEEQKAPQGVIAVVDDDDDFREVLGDVLRAAGYALRFYSSSSEALYGILQEPPDLILLDIVLGKEDGRELFRALRRESSLDLVPILFLTAYAEPGQVIFGYALGADDYIPKSVRLEELLTRVEARLERSRVVSRLALLDPLTGIGNRRQLDTRLRAELARAQREGSSLGVALLDMDRFKAINDHFGHPVGDEVLIQCAGVLREGVRPYDVVTRYGGEEFALLLPNVDAARARLVLERLRRALAERIKKTHPEISSVSFSAGVAIAPADGDEPAALLAVADRRLYQAKEQGRGRVISAG